MECESSSLLLEFETGAGGRACTDQALIVLQDRRRACCELRCTSCVRMSRSGAGLRRHSQLANDIKDMANAKWFVI